ncbi:MAG: DUF1059 domain-containing protein [Rhodococcus sp.]|nr:DUF1059 domain-containing protein [Rhodococcus sp. (in: high G+C Gram-positive bacteria)]
MREKTRLNCPCGEAIKAENEDELVKKVQEHLAADHPTKDYSRNEILFMAH